MNRLSVIEAVRRVVQVGFFVLFVGGIFGFKARAIALPILLSRSAYGRTMLGAYSTIELMLSLPLFPLLPLAVFILTAVFLGRAMCGWLCPFGLLQDLLMPIKRRHRTISPKTHESLLAVKHWVLFVSLFTGATLAVSLLLGFGEEYRRSLGPLAPGIFTALSPHESLFALIPRLILSFEAALPRLILMPMRTIREEVLGAPLIVWVKIVLLLLFLYLAIDVPRFFCKYVCPAGALMSLMSRFSFLGINRNPVRCTKCRACVEACPMNVKIMTLPGEKITDPECILCLRCIYACPEDALRLKFP